MKLTLADVIIETMPFSKELINWCKKYPEFLEALKITHPERFFHLGAVITSYSPNYPDDEVIGFYTYDSKRKLFKQDFIINKGKLNKEFILYTRNPKGSSKYVKDIKEFALTYGKGGHYVNSHHLSFNELPNNIKGRALRAMNLAESVTKSGLIKLSQEQIELLFNEITEIKKNNWIEWRKPS